MTTLKTPEEVTDLIDGSCVKWWFESLTTPHHEAIQEIITQDRQHIAEVLCDLLEGEKYKGDYIAGTLNWSQAHYNQALTEAQALIRQTLNPITFNSFMQYKDKTDAMFNEALDKDAYKMMNDFTGLDPISNQE